MLPCRCGTGSGTARGDGIGTARGDDVGITRGDKDEGYSRGEESGSCSDGRRRWEGEVEEVGIGEAIIRWYRIGSGRWLC